MCIFHNCFVPKGFNFLFCLASFRKKIFFFLTTPAMLNTICLINSLTCYWLVSHWLVIKWYQISNLCLGYVMWRQWDAIWAMRTPTFVLIAQLASHCLHNTSSAAQQSRPNFLTLALKTQWTYCIQIRLSSTALEPFNCTLS